MEMVKNKYVSSGEERPWGHNSQLKFWRTGYVMNDVEDKNL